MRKDILDWKHEPGKEIWKPFLDLFEKDPILVSDEEFEHIIKNSSKNFKRHAKSHYDPVRKCLNAIHNRGKFIAKDVTEIDAMDNNFLEG